MREGRRGEGRALITSRASLKAPSVELAHAADSKEDSSGKPSSRMDVMVPEGREGGGQEYIGRIYAMKTSLFI